MTPSIIAHLQQITRQINYTLTATWLVSGRTDKFAADKVSESTLC